MVIYTATTILRYLYLGQSVSELENYNLYDRIKQENIFY
jgi:hypothetical protein